MYAESVEVRCSVGQRARHFWSDWSVLTTVTTICSVTYQLVLPDANIPARPTGEMLRVAHMNMAVRTGILQQLTPVFNRTRAILLQ